MNTGIQDAVDLGHTLIDVLSGQAADEALDGYQQRRRPVAEQVVRLTDRATRLATLQGRVPRSARNVAMSVASRIPAVQRRLALQIAELANTPRPVDRSMKSAEFPPRPVGTAPRQLATVPPVVTSKSTTE